MRLRLVKVKSAASEARKLLSALGIPVPEKELVGVTEGTGLQFSLSSYRLQFLLRAQSTSSTCSQRWHHGTATDLWGQGQEASTGFAPAPNPESYPSVLSDRL